MDLSPNPRSRHVPTSTIVAVVISVSVIVGVSVFVLSRYFSGRESASSDAVNTASGGIRTYVSLRLGVRFSYAATDLGKQILVEEKDNTIYVYLEGTPSEEGQFVRVFSKDPSLTLQQAVERQFLQTSDPAACYVQAGIDVNSSLPSTGVAAVIAYPISTDGDDWLERADQCPAGYSLTNGLSYFWTDKDTADTFVFFSIGQYYIPASSVGTSWHTTLRFDSNNSARAIPAR